MTREEQLKAAQSQLQSGQLEAGLTAARALVEAEASDSEALYLAAVAARYLGRFDEAAQHLGALHSASPEYGRAWQEEGHLALARQDSAGALAAFARATRFNPALEASWREQARLHAEAGEHAQAQAAQAQLYSCCGKTTNPNSTKNAVPLEKHYKKSPRYCEGFFVISLGLITHPSKPLGLQIVFCKFHSLNAL